MDLDVWFPVFHVVSAVLWVGGLVAVLALLHVHPRVDPAARGALSSVERKLAILMDLGATLTIALGLWRALSWTPTAFAQGGWLHVKLTAVVVGILSVHGIARVKIKKFRGGDVRPVAPVVWILLAAGVIAAIALGGNPTLLRK